MNDLPRQLADFTPLPGVIKADYADFVVEEIPLYPADGVGTHTYFLVEKAGLTTQQAVRDIARALDVRRHDIGFAGQKDARAVTRQWMSVEHVEPLRVAELDLPRLRVLQTTQHHNKLRLGHLKGNAFAIRVRDTDPDRLPALQQAFASLRERGAPNYFGEQRFGNRGDTWEIGRAILRDDRETALDLMLGRPGPQDYGSIRQARELYDAGEYEQAAHRWPGMFHTERKVLRALARQPRKRRAFGLVDRSTRTFMVAAYQSHVFNQVVARRMRSGLHVLWDGDLAWLHANGAVFHVPAAATEQRRADQLEISPTGPLFGYRMSEPDGQAGALEAAVLAEESVGPDTFRAGGLRIKGGRRPLRFPLDGAQVALGADERGPYLEVRFTLPRGCYATTVLRELFTLQEGQNVGVEDTEDASI